MNTYEPWDNDVPKTEPCCAGHSADSVDAFDETLKKNDIRACQQELAEWKDKYLRIQADLDNLRRRVYREQEQAIWKAQAEILMPLLLIADNFDRTHSELSKQQEQAVPAVLLQGVSLMHKELRVLFERVGVKEIESIGPFDPTTQEAISSVAHDMHRSGDVVDILQKGYTFKGIVLRPAKVSVAQ
jgi:molecular chaperone GrpE